MSLSLHEDTFFEFFRPRRHPEAAYDIWGGLGLEIFGTDLQIVRSYDHSYVWTVLEGDIGPDEWIVPGIHYVNRICHLITEVPHNWIDVQFRVRRRLTSLTRIGLVRQSTQLRRELEREKVRKAI